MRNNVNHAAGKPSRGKEHEGLGPGEWAEVASFPPCDICKGAVIGLDSGENIPARYDGKTQGGPWGFMCIRHFKAAGIGLGTGRGQKLFLKGTK